MKNIFLFCLCLVHSLFCYSLQYSSGEAKHYVLGKTELAGVDIYDLHYSSNNLLYVATSNSLYVVQNDKIINYPKIDKQLGSAIFSLAQSDEGTIYFINLSGQLFSFENEKINLIHTFNKKDIAHSVQISTIGSGRLLFCSKSVIIFDHSKNTEEYVKFDNERLVASNLIQTKINDSLVGIPFTRNSNTYILYVNSTNQYFDTININTKLTYPKLFDFNGCRLVIDRVGNTIDLDSKRTFVSNISSNNAISISEQIFSINEVEGISEIIYDDSLLLNANVINIYSASAIEVNNKKTLFVGTFGEGIVVIPDKEIRSILPSSFKEAVGDFYFTSNNKLFFSTLEGGIYSYHKGDLQKVIEKTKTRLDNFYVFPFYSTTTENYQEFLNYEDKSKNNSKSSILRITDHEFLNENTVAFASYSGLSFYSTAKLLSSNLLEVEITEVVLKRFYNHGYLLNDSEILKRGVAIEFDSIAKMLYYANQTGLYQIDSNFDISPVTYNGSRICATDLNLHNNTLFIATCDNGLLKLHLGNIEPCTKLNAKLSSKHIIQLIFTEDVFMIGSKEQATFFDLDGSYLKKISLTRQGKGINGIQKYHILGDQLYLQASKNFYKINWVNHIDKRPTGKLEIAAVIFGDSTYSNEMPRSIPFKDNNLSIRYLYNDLLHYSDSKVEYRLVGLASNWITFSGSTQQIEYNYLPHGKYEFQIRLSYDNEIYTAKGFSFIISKPYYLQTWFVILMAVLVILVFLLIYLIGTSSIKKRNNIRVANQKLLYDSLESQLKSIRSQMNPHFIFNSLNSIQSLILDQNIDSSYDYVSMFSDLVRKTLLYSEEEFISIDQEKEFLNLYLGLESLRMPNEFEYDIVQLDNVSFYLPSLLVQPFVENSIHHGLVNKEGFKKLEINFFKEGDKFFCTITDNGIGRKKAKENENRNPNHKSFSLGAINKRMDIFNQKYGATSFYKIEDKIINGEFYGTIVTIEFPQFKEHE